MIVVTLVFVVASCGSDDEMANEPSIEATAGGSLDDDALPLLAEEEGDTESLEAVLYLIPVVVDGCLLVADEFESDRRYAGLWPHGTEASKIEQAVTLPDGQKIAFGEAFVAGGGVLQRDGAVPLADTERVDYAAAVACATDDIAVIDNLKGER